MAHERRMEDVRAGAVLDDDREGLEGAAAAGDRHRQNAEA